MRDIHDTPKCDFEDMLIEGMVYHYSLQLAEAYSTGDETAARTVAAHIEDNYGYAALKHVSQLAAVLVLNGEA